MNPAVGQGTIGGILTVDTTLGLANSPWSVTSPVTVPRGITLTVEAGVRVEFSDGAQISVDEGRMVADGTEAAPIVFGRPDGATHRWDGFVFEDTLEENRLTSRHEFATNGHLLVALAGDFPDEVIGAGGNVEVDLQ